MTDIYVALAIVFPIYVLIGVVAYRVACSRRRRGAAVLLVIAAAAALVLNVLYWREGLWPARVLPFSNMIVLADLSMPLVAVLVGSAAALMPGSPWRRSVLLVPLAGL